jgi:hypothetical protein
MGNAKDISWLRLAHLFLSPTALALRPPLAVLLARPSPRANALAALIVIGATVVLTGSALSSMVLSFMDGMRRDTKPHRVASRQ